MGIENSFFASHGVVCIKGIGNPSQRTIVGADLEIKRAETQRQTIKPEPLSKFPKRQITNSHGLVSG